jgi:ubiquinone/menaquinone biosynthesis C-methylase UbiE
MPEMESEGSSKQLSWVETFDTLFAGSAKSPTLRRLWREAFGDDYAEEADPLSFVTLTDLRQIASEIRVRPGQTFVDLACGGGGPGLWVAPETRASLIGIDFSPVAVEHAIRRAVAFGLAERTRFQLGDFIATGLPTASFDGAMSVDALLFVPDKAAAAREVARILRTGARFVFTTWDWKMTPPGFPHQVNDHHALLRDAGFTVEAYEERPGWEARQRSFYTRVPAAQADLIAEMGEGAAGYTLFEANLLTGQMDGTDYLALSRRILVVARKTVEGNRFS